MILDKFTVFTNGNILNQISIQGAIWTALCMFVCKQVYQSLVTSHEQSFIKYLEHGEKRIRTYHNNILLWLLERRQSTALKPLLTTGSKVRSRGGMWDTVHLKDLPLCFTRWFVLIRILLINSRYVYEPLPQFFKV